MLYAGVVKLVGVASAVVPPGATKTSIALRARRGIVKRYTSWSAQYRDATRALLWMHAPSVGEGLQARPVLVLMRSRHPEFQLAYTFFSPSAEEFSRSLDVDFRDYLPFDSAGDMRAALDSLQPRALVFSKLDVWPELVRQASRRRIRLGMISATLAAASGRRSRTGNLLLGDAYERLDAVGAIDQADAERLIELGVRRDVIEVTGDTRFDQVWQRAEKADRKSGLLARLKSKRPTLVAGSTWPSDESGLLDGIVRARARVRGLRVILAPHEPTRTHLEPVEGWAAQHALRLARVDDDTASDADVVLVDRVGILGELYAIADVAFVGGGFHTAGLHSVLEPAAYGAPVMFGPRHDRSRDAGLLLKADAARAVSDASDIERALVDWFENATARREAGARARQLIADGRGAAERSVRLVERLMQ